MTSFALHIDCDPLSVYGREYGIDVDRPELVYRQALPAFLDVFRAASVRATFFVIGEELVREDCREFCRRATAEGHAIGNHTQTHPVTFGSLTAAGRKAEIEAAHRIISEATGYRPIGFRAPGYCLRADVVTTLAALGYAYDSSALPGPATAMMAVFLRVKRGLRDKSFGVWSNLFASRRERMLSDGLVEVPIATMPWLRLPVHTTFVYQLGPTYLRVGLFLLNHARGHHVLLFHAIDLLDHPDRERLANHLIPMRWTFAERLGLVRDMVSAVASRCVQTEARYAASAAATGVVAG